VFTDRNGYAYGLPSYAEPIAQHLITFGTYESDTRDAILTHLPQQGTFIDVGANIGAISIPVAKSRPDACIVSVEADPKIVGFLKDNIRRNDCKCVQVLSCLAGQADDESVSFYRAPDDHFGMGSIGAQFGAIPTTLKQKTLDTLLHEIGISQVDVIKIDVEGAELGVLRGAQKLLSWERKPVVIFEFVDWAEGRIPGQSPGDAQRALLCNGYRLFPLKRGGQADEELVEPLLHGTAMLLAVPPHVWEGGKR
jgi:FkbM family methyltransferase